MAVIASVSGLNVARTAGSAPAPLTPDLTAITGSAPPLVRMPETT
jgi:hypothetical protein